jgi:lysophospholipase L1-like esterase
MMNLRNVAAGALAILAAAALCSCSSGDDATDADGRDVPVDADAAVEGLDDARDVPADEDVAAFEDAPAEDAVPEDDGAVEEDVASGDDGSPPPDGGTAIVVLRDDELDIMPLGDSITLGLNGGYRNNLFTSLGTDGYAVDMVGTQADEWTVVADKDHEGHPGYTTGGIRDEIDAWLAASDPDVVLLMAGTNDVAWWIAEPTSAVADRLEALVAQILAWRPGVVVVVGTIPPLSPQIVEPDGRERADLVVEYNAMIRTRFAGRDLVRVADVNAVLTVDDLYDGVHPNEAGHAKIAVVWHDALRPLLPTP